MKIENKKISLVTGGAGFIGSHVVDSLIEQGHRVIVLDDLSGGNKKNVNQKALFICGSVNNEKILDNIFKKYKIDYVYHLAAYAAEGLSHFIRKFNYENNLIGSVNLLNHSVNYRIKHFIFTSSIAVYGKSQSPMTESMTPLPEDPYGIAKYAFELDLKSAHEMFGLKYTIFRPHNVYGERQNLGDPYRNVLGIFINNLLQNKPMTIFSDGKQTRAFSYISDVAPYIARAIKVKKAENEVFNIGADKPYSVLDLAYIIAEAMQVEKKIIFLQERNEAVHAYSSHVKVKKIFKIKSVTDLKKGVFRMVNWAKKIGYTPTNKFNNIEINKNIPRSWQKLI